MNLVTSVGFGFVLQHTELTTLQSEKYRQDLKAPQAEFLLLESFMSETFSKSLRIEAI